MVYGWPLNPAGVLNRHFRDLCEVLDEVEHRLSQTNR